MIIVDLTYQLGHELSSVVLKQETALNLKNNYNYGATPTPPPPPLPPLALP